MRAQEIYRLPTNTRGRRRSALFAVLGGLLAGLYVALAIAASRLAHSLHYVVGLGAPLLAIPPPPLRIAILASAALLVVFSVFRRRWIHLAALAIGFSFIAAGTAYPVYPPAAFLLARRALRATQYGPLVVDAERFGAAAFLLLFAAVAPYFSRLFRSLVTLGDLHGSARFATPQDATAAGFILDDPTTALAQSAAIPLGLLPVKGGNRLLRVPDDVHLLLLAPPGAGKTTALVIPTVQDWPENLVVLDVKGELADNTAGHRQLHGSRILKLDPGSDSPDLARYNPLLSVRPHPYDAQDATELAQLLVPDAPGADPFWNLSARTLIEGILLHVLYSGREKTLAACYRMLCDPDLPSIERQFENMLATVHDPAGPHGWTHHPVVQTAARAFLDMPAQTRGGVIANAQAALHPYSDPILAAATSVSDFSLADLYLRRDRPVTLYLKIDPNSLQRLRHHIRIVISQITAAMTRELPTVVDRRPVLLVLDEFPVFGNMKVVEMALAYLRGYGVQVFIVVQHVDQLVAAYGKAESVSPNCSVHIAYAPAHLPTAEALSKRAGNQTINFERSGVSSHGPMSSHASFQQADTGRPLLTPDEIMRLPKGNALVLRTGCRPLLVQPKPYFSDAGRSRAAKLPEPPSEPTHPDFSHWLSREPAPLPPQPSTGRRERRAPSVLTPEPLR
jgi:type IV secretion system protein VirD4